MKRLAQFGLVCALPIGPTIHAAGKEPCCVIAGIDAASGKVTAREAGGRTFEFSVSDKSTLRSLRIGQKVHADFGNRQVSLDGVSPCCAILDAGETPAPASRVRRSPVEPCCEVTAIDRAAGIVTARWKSTGRIVKVKLVTPDALRCFAVGQSIDVADAGRGKLTVRFPELEPVSGTRVQ